MAFSVLKSWGLSITPMGVVLLGLFVLLALCAWTSQVPLLAWLVSLALAIFITGLGLGIQNLKRVQVTRILPKEVFAGQELDIGIKLENLGSLPSFDLKAYEDFERHRLIGPVHFEELLPKTKLQSNYSCFFKRRGESHFRQIQLRSRFPLVFFEIRKYYVIKEKLFVYPQIVPIKETKIPEDIVQCATGEFGLAQKKLETLRTWREGSKLSRVAWKLSAKRGFLIERTERTNPTYWTHALRLNLDTALEHKRWERHISELTTQALRVLALGGSVSIWKADTCLVPGGCGPRQRTKILRTLASIKPFY